MLSKTVFLLAILSGSAAIAEVADPSSGHAAGNVGQQAARPEPYAITGPVHIRFRRSDNVLAAAGSADPVVRRELAYHAEPGGKTE